MNRDAGQYFLPHILMGEILIKKHQIDKSNGNTKNIVHSKRLLWIRIENFCLSCYSTDPDESIYRF